MKIYDRNNNPVEVPEKRGKFLLKANPELYSTEKRTEKKTKK